MNHCHFEHQMVGRVLTDYLSGELRVILGRTHKIVMLLCIEALTSICSA